MTTLYVAGPMTGIEGFNYPLFNRVSELLRRQGFVVLNPAENDDGDEHEWHWFMRKALAQVVQADGIALLPDWEHSKGAMLEHRVAESLGMPIKYWQDWLL